MIPSVPSPPPRRRLTGGPGLVLAVACTLVIAAGCQPAAPPSARSYETVPPEPGRDTEAARLHNQQAAKLMEHGQLAAAEAELKAALAADVNFGPAHNNLGIVYYRQRNFYLAAWEFQYAAKLMPASPQPPNNLGLVFETVGRLDDAREQYQLARRLDGENVEVVANLARLSVRQGRYDDELRQLLQEVVMRDTREQWQQWARRQLALWPASQSPVQE